MRDRDMPSVKQTCPHCPGAANVLVFKDRSGNVVRCLSCHLEFAEFFPDLNEAGSEIYSPNYFEKALRLEEKRKAIYRQLLDEIETSLGGKGRLLDIGCGEGTLLRVAAEQGWQAEGTEVSAAAIRFSRGAAGILVHQGEAENLDLERGGFDAIVLNHVLEHVRDPVRTLARVKEWLKPDGLVRLEVPNMASFSNTMKNLQSRLGLKRHPWKHYATSHHFWFFTPSTLRRTLETAGLRVVRLKAPARQWGRLTVVDRALNILFGPRHWGGRLVVYARRAARFE